MVRSSSCVGPSRPKADFPVKSKATAAALFPDNITLCYKSAVAAVIAILELGLKPVLLSAKKFILYPFATL